VQRPCARIESPRVVEFTDEHASEEKEAQIEPPSFVLDSDPLALAFFVARKAHAGQTRGDHGRPYLEHPIQVAELLDEQGYPESTIAAALLHDVVEDSGLTVGDVVESFGVPVGELVAALTEDPAVADWEERKQQLRSGVAGAGREALAIYVADKLANLHDWRVVYAAVGEDAVDYFKAPTLDARIRIWRGDLELAEERVPDLALTPRFRDELEAFERQRTASRRRVAAAG
jgi:guanosine-3',5'-bis(diphosphate) 3'-pyrophosphohydrolase